jgi:hypothetical protein
MVRAIHGRLALQGLHLAAVVARSHGGWLAALRDFLTFLGLTFLGLVCVRRGIRHAHRGSNAGATETPMGGSVLAVQVPGGNAMKATDLLKKQHREVEGLFKKVEKAGGAQARRQLLDQIRVNLEAHTTIEEELFYPAIADLGTKKAEEMVNEAFEEHHVVKLVLNELPNVDPEDERFDAKMTVLSELIEHHVEEEEKEMFKLAGKIGKEEAASLAERMASRFEELIGQHGRRNRAA